MFLAGVFAKNTYPLRTQWLARLLGSLLSIVASFWVFYDVGWSPGAPMDGGVADGGGPDESAELRAV